MKDIFASLFRFKFPQRYRIIREGALRSRTDLLGNSIYPDWTFFSKIIEHMDVEEEKKFRLRQEATWKGIERLLVVFQTRFQIFDVKL